MHWMSECSAVWCIARCTVWSGVVQCTVQCIEQVCSAVHSAAYFADGVIQGTVQCIWCIVQCSAHERNAVQCAVPCRVITTGLRLKIRHEHRAKQGLASLMAIDFKEQEGGPETILSDVKGPTGRFVDRWNGRPRGMVPPVGEYGRRRPRMPLGSLRPFSGAQCSIIGWAELGMKLLLFAA